MVEHGDAVTQTLNLIEVMRIDEHGHVASAAQLLQQLAHHALGLGVETRRRFIEEEQFGVVNKSTRQPQFTLHAGRERAYLRVALVGQANEIEEFFNPAHVVAHAVKPGVIIQTLKGGHAVIQAAVLEQHAHACPNSVPLARDLTEHAHRAPRRLQQSQQNAHGGGLPCAVGTEEAEDLTGLDAEADGVQHGRSGRSVEALSEIDGFDDVHVESGRWSLPSAPWTVYCT